MADAVPLCYTAYGLAIQSAFALPELRQIGTGSDVMITIAAVPDPPGVAYDDGLGRHHVLPDGSAFFALTGVGSFLVRDGREVLVDPAPGVSAGLLRLYILGAALGTLLQQRRLLVLHASGVVIDDQVAVFLGQSGKGKSTLAAAFHARGHQIAADDVLAIATETEPPTIPPAFPQIKLWPDAARLFSDDPERLPRLHADIDKRTLSLTSGFASGPLPAARLYVLSRADAVSLAPLTPRETLLELIAHTYTVRAVRAEGGDAHFAACARVARQVPGRRLSRSSMDDLPAMVRLVEEDFGHRRG